jgi:3-dehydroquinate dehydratase II
MQLIMKNITILIINGPNLNMLGVRDHHHYGSYTLEQIISLLEKSISGKKIRLEYYQSNHEGDIVDRLQKVGKETDGILINPGALTHYGYSMRDALADTKKPIVEVHLSDVDNREDFRKIDVLDGIVTAKITSRKEQSYLKGLKVLITHIYAGQ